jgi:hypothetical protein
MTKDLDFRIKLLTAQNALNKALIDAGFHVPVTDTIVFDYYSPISLSDAGIVFAFSEFVHSMLSP